MLQVKKVSALNPMCKRFLCKGVGRWSRAQYNVWISFYLKRLWFLSHSPSGKPCFCLELQHGERIEAVMNGSTQPSQLVEQVKAAGKGNIHSSECVLSAQSSIKVTWLEEKVLPFILPFAVSWLWRSFTVFFMVLKSLFN